jgi:hypothetical protein
MATVQSAALKRINDVNVLHVVGGGKKWTLDMQVHPYAKRFANDALTGRSSSSRPAINATSSSRFSSGRRLVNVVSPNKQHRQAVLKRTIYTIFLAPGATTAAQR